MSLEFGKPAPKEVLARCGLEAGSTGFKVRRAETNPCLILFGKGPEKAVCRECRFFNRIPPKSCDQRTDTKGPEHRSMWPACGLFQATKPAVSGESK